MAQIATISWSSRPARLVEKGPEQSVIQWLDTQEEQVVITSEISITEVLESVAEITKKHKLPGVGPKRAENAGPTKMDQAIEIVRNAKTLVRAELIQSIMDECKMSKAGATTYYYNATKIIKGETK